MKTSIWLTLAGRTCGIEADGKLLGCSGGLRGGPGDNEIGGLWATPFTGCNTPTRLRLDIGSASRSHGRLYRVPVALRGDRSRGFTDTRRRPPCQIMVTQA